MNGVIRRVSISDTDLIGDVVHALVAADYDLYITKVNRFSIEIHFSSCQEAKDKKEEIDEQSNSKDE